MRISHSRTWNDKKKRKEKKKKKRKKKNVENEKYTK